MHVLSCMSSIEPAVVHLSILSDPSRKNWQIRSTFASGCVFMQEEKATTCCKGVMYAGPYSRQPDTAQSTEGVQPAWLPCAI